MLIDDITRGINSIGTGFTRVVTGAIRGALLFAGIAFIASAAFVAWPLLAAPAGGALTLAIVGSALKTATLASLGWAKLGAMIGAPVMAAASIIPGKDQDFGLKRIISDPPERTSSDLQAERARTMEQMPPNPGYKPGLGAALAQRNAAEQQQQNRTV